MSIATATGPRIALGPGEGEAIWFLRNRMTIKATAELTGGGFGLVEVEIPAGYSPPTHVHHREEESFYVLEGELTFRCGDTTFEAQPGSFICLPRDVPHSFFVKGDRPARMLNLMTPGTGEGYFREAGRPAEGEGLPPAAPVDVTSLQRAGELYDAKVVGPPMASATDR